MIDIGHPAHVHALKHFAHEMERKGHKVLFTCRAKEFITQLLKSEGFQYISLGDKYKHTFGKVIGLFKFDYLIWKICLEFKPDLFLSLGSPYAAHVSFLMKKPHISFEDTYNLEQVILYRPFTNLILTGDYEHPNISKRNEFRMAGYNELAYLHPNRFKPDESVLKELGVTHGEKFVVIRFVAWNASHDIGHNGMTLENKYKVVHEFEKYAKVFISSENNLPDDFDKYQLPTHPSRIHDVIAFSSLVFGESSTMSEEAAMLGIPSIYINDKSTFYTKHLENDYHLVYNLTESESDQEKAIELGIKLLCSDNVKKTWEGRQLAMLQDRIDVTSFLIWLVENYPASKQILKDNPDYQYRFK